MRTLFAFGLVLGVSLSARADDAIPPDVLNHIKSATVFVKVRSGPAQGTGSGFLMQVDGDSALIVTNEHVVSMKSKLNLPPPRVEVVFNSGRKTEMTVPTEIVAVDKERDLAILRVKNVKDLPKPIDVSQKVELGETMPVFMFGFPFGQQLSTSKGNPAMTIGKGSISSLRENDRGQIARIQIDGDLNPGNSGGPVVDNKGRLVGVAVAKILGTNIGMAIPPRELSEMLEGRVSELTVSLVKVENGEAELEVRVQFIDPIGKIEGASIRYVRSDSIKAPLKPDKEGNWPELPDAAVADLKIEKQIAVGKFKVKSDKKEAVLYTLQPVYAKNDKTLTHAQPAKPYRVDFSGGVAKIDPKAGTTVYPNGTDQTGPGQDLGDLNVKSLAVGSGKAPACLCWAEDAKSFYHLDGAGVVRRIGYPELKEESVLDTKKKCAWISLSSLGLVVTVAEAQEAWLLDAKDLQVAKKMPIVKAKRVVSSPKSVHAYAVESDAASATLTVLDLKEGKVGKQYQHGDLKIPGGANFDNPIVSPDGKFLFATGGAEMMMRFKLNGEEVEFEESTGKIIQGRFDGLCIGCEGDYVCAPCANGNNLEGAERVPYLTYLYAAGNLSGPSIVLRSGPYPIAVGFDMKSGLIYGQNFQSSLIVFNDKGTKLKEYKLDAKAQRAESRQLLVHPNGRKLLVLCDEGGSPRAASKVWSVELPPK